MRNNNIYFILLICAFLLLFFPIRIKANDNITAILEYISADYDRRVRPDINGIPTSIFVSVFVESLGPLHELEMDFSSTFYLQMYWIDTRLRFQGERQITLKSTDMDKFWLPDIHFLYEKKSHHHNVIQPNKRMIINYDGTCEYSVRVSLTVLCNMVLDRFPMDTQKCGVHMMSYAYKASEMQLFILDSAIRIPKTITVSKYDFLGFHTDNFNETFGGDLEGVYIEFEFKRQIQTYILTVYIPSVLLVIISWMSFWIDAHAAPARVSLGITTVLTATTMTASMQESFPSGTNAKAIDVWLATCLIFVFLALIEYALANYLIVLQERHMIKAFLKSNHNFKEKPQDDPVILNSERSFCALRDATYAARYRESLREEKENQDKNDKDIPPPPPTLKSGMPVVNVSKFTAENMDKAARVVFFLFFLIFNMGYWPYYLFNPDADPHID
ncbi:glycine receptor subunit alpha-2-like isoform X2 [Amphiura filiformis]|uniref:glycine receptor subunit alpha-2-like isoform X2 n=1 Tax=Amphiura filiformis TaxID=82378 RepID=UPI003B219A17